MLDHYTLLAPVYDLATARVLSPLRETVGRLVAEKGFVRVLDVGCGTGVQCVMLHALGCRTTGLDASPAMLARARRQSPAGVAYVRSDASGMPFADTAFDAAIISLALHENKPAVRTAILKEMRRVVAARRRTPARGLPPARNSGRPPGLPGGPSPGTHRRESPLPGLHLFSRGRRCANRPVRNRREGCADDSLLLRSRRPGRGQNRVKQTYRARVTSSRRRLDALPAFAYHV